MYTTALASSPCPPTRKTGGIAGVGLAFAQGGCAAMSMAGYDGGVPSSVTVPLILAAVDASTVAVAAGAEADSCSAGFLLLQPAPTAKAPQSAKTPRRPLT